MATNDGAPIIISAAYIHYHEPAPNHAMALRCCMNRLRESTNTENVVPQNIVD